LLSISNIIRKLKKDGISFSFINNFGLDQATELGAVFSALGEKTGATFRIELVDNEL